MTQRYSYSAIQDFKACPLRFYLKHEVGLRLRSEGVNQHHLAWGKAMHSALEVLYGGSSLWPPYATTATFSRDLQIEFAKEVFTAGYPVQLDPEDKAKTQENGLRVLDLYARKWIEEDKRWKVLDVELLDCDLLDEDDEEAGYYSRRLDMVVEDLQFGGIYGVDHKTVGGRNKQLKGGYWDTFDPNSQITQYIDWIKQKYGRCDGFYINAIGVNWVDQLDARGYFNGSSFEPEDPAKPWLEFSHYELQTPKGKKVEKMRAWGLKVEFRREMFSRSDVQIQQEQESTNHWIQAIEHARKQMGWFDSEELTNDPVNGASPWGFNTASCTYCEFKGNDAQPGPCKAGWSWPTDQTLIELSYRRECRQVIMLVCPDCDNGFDENLVDFNRRHWDATEGWIIKVPVCVKCKGTATIQGPRCVLDLNHTEECSNVPPVVVGRGEFEVEVTL